MIDFVENFRNYLRDKASNPLLPAFVISWTIINYPVPIILFESGEAYSKIDSIRSYLWPDGVLNESRAILYPLYSAMFYSFIFPIITGGIIIYQDWLTKFKTDLQLKAIRSTAVAPEKLKQIYEDHSKELLEQESELARQKRTIESLRDLSHTTSEKLKDTTAMHESTASELNLVQSKIRDYHRKLNAASKIITLLNKNVDEPDPSYGTPNNTMSESLRKKLRAERAHENIQSSVRSSEAFKLLTSEEQNDIQSLLDSSKHKVLPQDG